MKPPIPSAIQEIEVTYVDKLDPTVSLKPSVPPSPPQSYRPSGSPVDLLSLITDVRPFGNCEMHVDQFKGPLKLQMTKPSAGQGGLLLSLQKEGAVLDALSYNTLHLRGETTGPITLALADEAAWRRGDNVPLMSLTGHFDLQIRLPSVARRLDLRYLTALVLLPQMQADRVIFESLSLERTASAHRHKAGLGFWLWRYHNALAQSGQVLTACQRAGCTRISVQMPSLQDPDSAWRSYARFLATAQEHGIAAFALDGHPEAIYDTTSIIQKVNRLRSLTVEGSWAGLQLDIEPYLLEGWVASDSNLLLYLAAIDAIKAALPAYVRFSVVMPFWFTSLPLRGRPVAFGVIDQADEVAIMSYRTDLDELRTIAEDALRYGDMTGIPVWLSVETAALPLERHLLLRPEPRRDLADAYLDRLAHRLVLAPPSDTHIQASDWFRVHHRVEVQPERLTFAGQSRKRVQEAAGTLLNSVSNPSLAGVLIHDLDAFLALPE